MNNILLRIREWEIQPTFATYPSPLARIVWCIAVTLTLSCPIVRDSLRLPWAKELRGALWLHGRRNSNLSPSLSAWLV